MFAYVDPGFAERARSAGGGVIAAGENYGQGSSREHAALAPAYLGVRIVLARSFARIHRDNLVNYGVLPLTLDGPGDRCEVRAGERLMLRGARDLVAGGATQVSLERGDGGRPVGARIELSCRQRRILLAGGLLSYVGAGGA